MTAHTVIICEPGHIYSVINQLFSEKGGKNKLSPFSPSMQAMLLYLQKPNANFGT